MISNDEWQTLARNIESVSSNWRGDFIGSGALNQGYAFLNISDNDIINGNFVLLEASVVDDLGCLG